MKKRLVVFFIILIGLISGIYGFYQSNLTPVSADNKVQSFVINQGEGIDVIGERLEKTGLIHNKWVFMFTAYRLGIQSNIKAGLFRLSAASNTTEILQALTKGGSQDYWLKIIGGFRVEQVAATLPSELDVSSIEFINQTADLEGYLFPDSYLIPQYYELPQVLEIIKKNFDKKLTQAKADATNTDMSDSEIITFASIIEREARTLNSKQEVAGILQNRLDSGMPIQVDASVQYARDSKFKKQPKYDYWQPVKPIDLDINSVFNTYKNPGLPPSPICNPGYDSIFAALHPIKSENKYYITGNDNQMHYAQTFEQHKVNIVKYLK